MKEVWDKKAKHFPRYTKDSQEDKPIFDFFKDEVDLCGKNVLDLGCGNGRYALALAQSAKNVLCFDISPNMLKNVEMDAKSHNITNIRTFCGDWENFDLDEFGEFKDNIDIIFASLTPALNSFEKFQKAYNLTKEAIMYIGWGRKRENEFLSEVFKAHNSKVLLPVGVMNVREYLQTLGKETPPVHFITKSIIHRKTLKDTINDVAWQLEVHNEVPNYELIKDIALKWKERDCGDEDDFFSSDSIDSIGDYGDYRAKDSTDSTESKAPQDSQESTIISYKSVMEIGLMVIKK